MRTIVMTTRPLLLLAMLIAPLAAPIRAQGSGYFFSEVKIAGSRNADQALAKARSDLANGEVDRCVRLVQEVLDAYGPRGILTESGRFVGIREYCNEFLDQLPPEGLAAYRKIYDPYAQELFDRGVAGLDIEALKQVYLRYLHTSFGREAMSAAFSIDLEKGSFHDAVGIALLYMTTYGAEDDGYQRALAAVILGLTALGDADRLSELSADLDPERRAMVLRIGGEETVLGALLDEALAKTGAAAMKSVTPPRIELLEEPRWAVAVPMQGQSGDTPNMYFDFNRQVAPSYFGWNPVIPAVDEGTVYVSNGIGVRATGLYSGAVKWTHEGPVDRSQARRNLAVTFPVVVDRDRVFVSLETPVAPERRIWSFVPQQPVPHRQLFALEASTGRVLWTHYGWRGTSIEDREFVSELNVNSAPLVIGDDVFVAATKFHTSYHHYLCCFDRETGALRWSTFVCTGQMEQNMFGNRVREAIAGELAEKDGRIYYSTNIGVVAAIDIRLGTLEFTTEYEQIPIPRQERYENAIHERAPSWAANAPIIVGDWVYVTPQDSQKLLAVNRHSGRLRETGVERSPTTRWRYVLGPYENQLVIAGSKVSFFDTETGQIRTASFAQVKVAGSSNVRRLGVQGRPLIIGNRLFAPVKPQDGLDLVRVWNLDNLKLEEEVRLTGARGETFAGNMAGNEEVIVIATTDPSPYRTTQVRCYYDRGAVRTRLERDITAAPRDPRVHFRMGEFALQGASKDYATAVASFETAWSLSGGGTMADRRWGERARDALYRIYIEMARSHRSAQRIGLDARSCFEKALEVARDDDQRVDIRFYLLALAVNTDDVALLETQLERLTGEFASANYDYADIFRGVAPDLARSIRYDDAGMVATVVAALHHESKGRDAEALEQYQRILREFQTGVVGGETAWMYAFRRVEGLLRLRGRGLYAPYEKEAARLLAEARESSDLGALERVLDRFPNATIVPSAYRSIAERHMANGAHEAAVAAVHDYLWRFRDPQPQLLAHLARSLEEAGCVDSARQVWAGLADVDASIEIDGASVKASHMAAERLSKLGTIDRKTAQAPPVYGVGAVLEWTSGSESDADDWLLIRPRGRVPAKAADTFLAHREIGLSCFGVDSAKPRWTLETSDVDEDRTLWFDGRLIGVFDGEVSAIDAASGEVQWRNAPEDLEIDAVAAGHGKVYIIATARGFSPTFRLMAYSILDGQLVFDTVLEGDPYETIHISDRWVMVVNAESRVHVLDGLTGETTPGLPDGFDFDGVLSPFLDARGRIIAATRKGDEREIVAIDPATRRQVWHRLTGEGITSFEPTPSGHTLTYWVRPNRGSTEGQTVVVIDLATGVSLLKRRLQDRVTALVATSNDAYVTCRATSKSSTSRLQYFCEAIDFSTGATDWRTLTFGRANYLTVQPFTGGVAIMVVERVRRSRRTPYRNKTTIYLVDGKSGRVEEEIELTTSRLYDRLLTFAGGRMAVADGPVLRVYKP